ncbi:phosphotransferase [uncultured Tenacibaculum sp.]|uniref:phosphotransferase n=1 Tax=uncultured Tenacibaculum sp. TaxID=174713 RepID=UPI0026330720|nr:phosphotransferase [uncultured Tenacibaculum sp.]
MRISELVKREPFFNIIESTLIEAKREAVIGSMINNNEGVYYINKYLNFITTLPKTKHFFTNLSNEYSVGKTYLRTVLQSSYVFLATNRMILPILCKKIRFQFTISDFLIIGGNHRMRLSNEIKGQIYVLLKKGEDTSLISNEINFRKSSANDVSYIPKLINHGMFWFQEEFIYATPINRLKNTKTTFNLKLKCYELHEKELLKPNLSEINVLTYFKHLISTLEVKIWDVASKFNNKEINNRAFKTVTELNSLKDLINKYSDIIIPISLNHGDFQSSNILINSKNKPVVIDWEMVSNRFMFYDLFVLVSGIREGNNLIKAFEKHEIFKQKNSKYFIKTKGIPDELYKLLILIEEFSFLIMNDWSINFFNPGVRTDKFIKEYNSFLYD